MWVLDLIDLVDADFRHFYSWPPDWGPGIADDRFPPAMGAEQFFRLCDALKYKTGSAVRGWADNEKARQQHEADGNGRPTPGPPPAPAQDAPPRDPDQLALSPGFQGDGQGMPPVIGRMKKRTN